MRFIHTSDWHLGQTLHSFERHYEHQQFLDWLITTLETEQADALLISGDIFDTANPSASAQKQFYTFLQQAKARLAHLNIIIIAGNHDSPGRLEAPSALLASMDVSVIGFVPRNPDGSIDLSRLVIPLKTAAGKITAWCLAIPFLRPGDVPKVEAENVEVKDDAGFESNFDPYMAGIALLYRQCLEYAVRLRQPGQAIIALGHCHMVGAATSEESERRIVIGGTEALSASMFDSTIAYAALGHLHLAQRVGRQQHLRYCGSPLPMSFAEIDYPHQVLRVDLNGEQVAEIHPVLVPRAVALVRIPAKPAPLAEVLMALENYVATLPCPQNTQNAEQTHIERQPYLEVRVRLDTPEPGLRAAIEAVLEGKAVRLAKIETSFLAKKSAAHASGNDDATDTLAQLEKLQPDDIFTQLYQHRYQSAAPPEMQAAFREIMLGNSELSSGLNAESGVRK